MLKFVFFGIPVQIQPWFWLTAAFISGALSLGSGSSGMAANEEVAFILTKMFMVFTSIFIHELGHTYVLTRLGARPAIFMHAFGGLAMWRGMIPSRAQQVVISLAGPAAGFFFAALLIALAELNIGAQTLIYPVIQFGIFINLVWNILNLLPIYPLDGGQVLQAALGRSGEKTCRLIGMILAAGVAIFMLTLGQFFAAILFGFLAYSNWKGQSISNWMGPK